MPTLYLTLHSDWRIGSGTGRPGDIDQLIRRDRTHTPYIPAKTIIGIWRDGCERVAHALDSEHENNSNTPTWTDWVTYLFGNHPNHPSAPQGLTPAPAHLTVESAHFPKSLRAALTHKPALQSTLTFVKPGVKINAASGTAEDQCFRLEEMARGGITLTPTFEVSGLGARDNDTWRASHALLAAGAAVVERIGGKRRRGTGHCTLSLTSMTLAAAHTYLCATATPPACPHLPEETQPHPTDTTKSSSWYRVPLTLTTQQPVIIAKATVGNVVESLDYIPGSHLLPIITRHLRSFGIDISHAIAHSQFIVTNALPSIDNQPTAPIPYALFYTKQASADNIKEDASHRSYTISHSINKLQGEDSNGQQRKQYRGGYITSLITANNTNDALSLEAIAHAKITTPDTAIETHNTINDNHQRPTSDVGGVYSYQSIPAGTTLTAELRLQADLFNQLKEARRKGNQQKWYEQLNRTDSIGLSRKDEYGKVEFTADKPIEIGETQSTQSTREFTVWLLSDLLLRDEWLRPTTDIKAVCDEIAGALNLEKGSLSITGANTLLARARRTESWQTRWGLPRPSLAGLSAGSCFRLSLKTDIPEENLPSPAAIAQLETAGLGERRVEGYGQICINAPLLDVSEVAIAQQKASMSQQGSKPPEVKSKDTVAFNYARVVEEVAWKDAIQRASETLAGKASARERYLHMRFNDDDRSSPSLSQLGRLRSQLSRIHDSPAALKSWVASGTDPDNSKRDSFTATLECVQDLLTNTQSIWAILNFSTTLGLENGYDDLCCTQNGEEDLKKLLWADAVEIWVSECIRAQSRESEARSNSTQNNTQLQEAS